MTGRAGPAGPERSIAGVLASATHTLVDDFDLPEALHDLTAGTAAVFGRKALVGIMLARPSGGLLLVASSDEGTDATGLLRLQIYQRGPCVECLNTGEVISVRGLGVAAQRWPSFVTAALALGFHALHAVPMHLNVHTVGVLNLLCPDPGQLDTRVVALAQSFADLAVISLHQRHCLARHGHLAEQVHATLNSQAVLEQAQGVLAEEGHIDIRDTLAPLRDYACSHHLRLTELARRITADHHQARLVLAARS